MQKNQRALPEFSFVFFLIFLVCSASPSKPPLRVACGFLACDEILAEWIVQGIETFDLVALSGFADDENYSNVPAPIRSRVKARLSQNLEAILALKPDLVLLSSYNRQDYAKILAKAGIRLATLPAAPGLAGIEANILELGNLVGAKQRAQSLAASVRAEAERAKKLCNAEAKVQQEFRFVHFYPENGSISGSDSSFSELARLACGRSLTEDLKIRGWPVLNPEALLSLKADLLIVAETHGSKPGSALAKLRAHPRWRVLPNVKDGRVLGIEDRYLSSQSHHLLKALAPLAAARKAQR